MEESKEISDRGLLDLSVELSTRDIMAGNDFTLYVLINNPFTKPVWIRRVHVNLPSELRLARPKLDEHDFAIKKSSENSNEVEKTLFDEKIALISQEISKLDILIARNSECTEDIKTLKINLENKLSELIRNVDKFKNSSVQVNLDSKASIGNIKIASKNTQLNLDNGASTGNIEILDDWMEMERYAHVRKVELESSLPENIALQLGNTVVYSVVLNVNNALQFRPSKYRLQFNSNYSFNPKSKEKETVNEESSEEELFTNTIAYELSIRASIYSVIKGSAIGGFVGGIARILQLHPSSIYDITTWSNFITISASIILGIMSIIFMARKSDSQSFVSIEDFWGGILVGFLVGYTGTSFFDDLTGISKQGSRIDTIPS